ncbi:hypothetical protein [Nannocystis pusilla]|uniref:hypothetical protein n=1 Tax=Nannocystis pusilla TaxID=889268 RepID=UPI003B7FD486
MSREACENDFPTAATSAMLGAMADAQETGTLGMLALLIGGGCLLVALLSAVNVAFELELALQVYGSQTELPRSWDGVVGLAAVGALLIGLTSFGGLVRRKFAAAKGRPLVRVGILVGAGLLLAGAFRGLQVAALVHTYGSMLAYYATDGDLDDVRAELAKGQSGRRSTRRSAARPSTTTTRRWRCCWRPVPTCAPRAGRRRTAAARWSAAAASSWRPRWPTG